MKRFVSFSLLLLLLLQFLAACAPGRSAGQCTNGLCIMIRNVGSIKKDLSIPIEIKIKSDKDQSEVTISMSAQPGITVEDVTDNTDVTYKHKKGVVWKKKLKAGQEVILTQNVRFPTNGDYSISVVVSDPRSTASDGIVFLITDKGGTAYKHGTPIPDRTPAPLPTAPTPTWFPTYTKIPSRAPTETEVLPTPTEEPSPTVTLPAYP